MPRIAGKRRKESKAGQSQEAVGQGTSAGQSQEAVGLGASARPSQEAVGQGSLKNRVLRTAARKEPETISSPNVRSPETMRRQEHQSSKATVVSPPVKKKNLSEVDNSTATPPAQTLAAQLIIHEELTQPEHIGEVQDEGQSTSGTGATTAQRRDPCSPLPELHIEMEKKHRKRPDDEDSDSEEFFCRLENTMSKLARKYIMDIDSESSDSGVEQFERLYNNALDSDDE